MTSTMATTLPPAATTSQPLQQQQQWTIGQIVDVNARMWPGINRPGGTGIITKIHYSTASTTEQQSVDSLDVKYTVNGGSEQYLIPELVRPHEEVSSRSRRRSAAVIVPDGGAENARPNHKHKTTTQNDNKHKNNNHATSTTKKSARKLLKASTALTKGQRQPLSQRKSQKKRTPTNNNKAPSRQRRKALDNDAATTLAATTVPDIPREIIFGTMTSNTHDSMDDDPDDTSPLTVQGGVPPPRTFRFDTAKAQRGGRRYLDDEDDDDDSASRDEMECDDDNNSDKYHNTNGDVKVASGLVASPQRRSRSTAALSATHMAAGQYSVGKPRTAAVSSADVVAYNNRGLGSEEDDSDDDDDGDDEYPTRVVRLTSLQTVYDDCKQGARQFIRDVVVTGCPDTHNNSDKTSLAQPSNSKDFEQRLHLFGARLLQIVDADGMVEESEIGAKMAELLAAPSDNDRGVERAYTPEEISKYVQTMGDENKLMLSEGFIYMFL